MKHKIEVPNIIIQIAQAINQNGGTAYVVGGYVRDQIMGIKSKDIDLEIFGLTKNQMVDIIKEFGTLQQEVGVAFTASKLKCVCDGVQYDLDIALPRRERKIGTGHKSFDVEFDPMMTTMEAASRRDFTINALMYNPITNEIIDHFDGLKHIFEGILKHTSEKFAEDPLRVLRGIQFLSRFQGFNMHKDTVEMCKSLIVEFETISKERFWTEFEKMLIKSTMGIYIALSTLYFTEWSEKFNIRYDGQLLNNCQHIAMMLNRFNISSDIKLQHLLSAICLENLLDEESIHFLNVINCPKDLQSKVLAIVRSTNLLITSGYEQMTMFNIKRIYINLGKQNVDRYIFNLFLNLIEWEDKLLKDIYFNMTLYISDNDYVAKITGDDLKIRGYSQGKALGDELKRLFNYQLQFNYDRETLLTLINPVEKEKI